jgi:antitoxin CptB
LDEQTERDRAWAGALHWRSRRGMLELDLQLVPFFEAQFANLSAADRMAYARLIEHEDWQIYDWLQGRATPSDEALVAIVERIRAGAGGVRRGAD